MKLLLDENLSPALVGILSVYYPETAHIRDLGLKAASDPAVWAHALETGYTIVTKDTDFHHRSFLYGHPPRVIWIRVGNCSTYAIAELLKTERRQIQLFHLSPDRSFLILP